MGPICSTCVHSQIHLHYMCNIYSNNRLTTFPRLLNCWPPKIPQNARWIHRRVPNLVPIGRTVWQLFQTFEWMCDPLTPPNAPCGNVGRLVFSIFHSQVNPQTWTKVGANRSSRLTASPDFWMFGPLKPQVSQRAICLAYIQSQINLHMCAKFGANRSSRLTASTYFWICDSLKPPKMPPGILRGELYLAYIHSQMNPQTCTTFGANQSRCLTASPDFWICDPPP